MTIETLFETSDNNSKPKTVRFRQIKAVYETMTVKDSVSSYLKTGTRYSAPREVYETFRFLMQETKRCF